MADVRGASGVPGLLQFGGGTTPTPSTPLYIDLATGDLYANIGEVVTLVGSIAGGSSFTIANQAFGKHFVQPGDVSDANQNMATRSFATKPTGFTDNSDANQTLEGRVFRQRDGAPQAYLGDASSILAQLSFQPRPRPAFWS